MTAEIHFPLLMTVNLSGARALHLCILGSVTSQSYGSLILPSFHSSPSIWNSHPTPAPLCLKGLFLCLVSTSELSLGSLPEAQAGGPPALGYEDSASCSAPSTLPFLAIYLAGSMLLSSRSHARRMPASLSAPRLSFFSG